MLRKRTSWFPIFAIAALLAGGVLRFVLPESMASLAMSERAAALGMLSLIVWLWATCGLGRIGKANPVWPGWLGLIGATLLFSPALLWVLLAIDPLGLRPPRWINRITIFSYPLILLWAVYRLQWAYSSARQAQRDLASLLEKKK